MKTIAGVLLASGIFGCGASARLNVDPPLAPEERGAASARGAGEFARSPQDGARLESSADEPQRSSSDLRDPPLALGPVRIPPGSLSTVRVRWEIPAGTGVNDEAPFRVVWASSRGLTRLPAPTREKGTLAKDGFEIQVEPVPGAKTAELTGVLDMVVCDVVTHSVCLPVRRTLSASFAVESGAAPATLSVPLPAAGAP